MSKNWILDMDNMMFDRIRKSSQTPSEAQLNFHQLQDFQKSIEIVKFQVKPNTEAKWLLFVAFKIDEQILVLSHQCKQLPSFLLDEVFEVIERHSFQIQNNMHVMNQFLNQNGFKNYDLIKKEIFLQEMQFQLEVGDNFTAQDRFKDYFFLFQSTLSRILRIQNVISLVDNKTKNLLFDFLNIENSLKDLNNDYLTLFFLNKKNQAGSAELQRSFFEKIIPFYQNKVEYHLNLLANYLDNFLKLNRNSNLTATEFDEDFQSLIIHLSNLKEFFDDIISEYTTSGSKTISVEESETL